MAQVNTDRQAQRLVEAFERIMRSLESDPIRMEKELTKPQLFTLFQIAKKKCCTMTELAKLTGYATSACTGIVDRMIRKKLVQRVRDEDDRRVVKVQTTSKGLETAEVLYRKVIDNARVVLEKVNEEEREKLVSLFEKISGGFAQQN